MNAAVSFIGGTNGNKKGLSATLAANPGDLKLRASLSDTNFSDGSTLNFDDLLLSVEKPGSFIIDFDIPQKDVQFQFMNTFKVEGKQINWSYTHMRNDHRAVLDGTLVFDTANKLSARHELGSFNCKLKYSYVHRGLTTFEPCYDLEKKSWDLAVSRRILGGDLVKANYETLSQVLGVEWSCSSLVNEDGRVKTIIPVLNTSHILSPVDIADAPFPVPVFGNSLSNIQRREVSASFNLAEGFHTPKLSVQSMWNFQA
ncbi:hypothetical protein CXB51_010153 [Gossypium anomalum]|uniref:Uncharacterized protein n=1 Tax=Gossypium anomalum TaxID=47600 RepID=A0A8J6D6G1_9ROSI|nr:hypothetical protein CXB51_010153 [Gossypium anomalum]